jgi:signal transduction histidine kinase
MHPETTSHYSILIASLVFLTIILGLFSLGLFFQYRLRLQEYEAQLAREIELIDAERKRIHIDLHDEIGSGLASIGVLVQQQVSGDETIQKKIRDQVTSMRSKIKEIAYDFVPTTLHTQGLPITIKALVDEMTYTYNITTKCTIDIHDTLFNPVKSIHIYRIIKEVLTNSLRHAHCKQVTCSIKQEQKTLTVILTDDGIGFNSKAIQANGTGVSHIYSRAKILRAAVDIESSRQYGTRYTIQIPLESLV